MRRFRHLSAEQRRSIIVGYLGNEPKISIARRLNVDNATVHYHIRKIKQYSERELYRLIQPSCGPCEDGHLSFRCLVCGTAHDNIVNEEFQEILRLRSLVSALESRLATYEKTTAVPSRRYPPHPIVAFEL